PLPPDSPRSPLSLDCLLPGESDFDFCPAEPLLCDERSSLDDSPSPLSGLATFWTPPDFRSLSGVWRVPCPPLAWSSFVPSLPTARREASCSSEPAANGSVEMEYSAFVRGRSAVKN